MMKKIIQWIKGLSFRTGVAVLASCVIFYLLSFAAFAVPIPWGWRTALWTVFFGLAKTAQYSGLLILGKEGWLRVKNYLKFRKTAQ